MSAINMPAIDALAKLNLMRYADPDTDDDSTITGEYLYCALLRSPEFLKFAANDERFRNMDGGPSIMGGPETEIGEYFASGIAFRVGLELGASIISDPLGDVDLDDTFKWALCSGSEVDYH